MGSGDQTTPVDYAECGRQANSDAQEASQVERLSLVPFKNPIQGLTARVRLLHNSLSLFRLEG